MRAKVRKINKTTKFFNKYFCISENIYIFAAVNIYINMVSNNITKQRGRGSGAPEYTLQTAW